MTPTTHHPEQTTPVRTRTPRGVLLLIVLSMLTLFMMLGTTYMVVTTRARATARAFARASAAQGSASDAAGRRMVDDAFRILARGTTDVQCQEQSLRTGDDLLGDKYGKTFPAPNVRGRYGKVESCSALPGGLLKITLLNNGVSLPPAAVNGRIVTLTFPGMCRSRRILSAAGTAQATKEIIFASVSPVDGSTIRVADVQRGLSATSGDPNADHIVINGREFVGDPSAAPMGPLAGIDTNEAYDGLGDVPNTPGTMTDPFLASLVATDSSDAPFDVYANATNPDSSIQPNVSVRKMSFFPFEADPANPTNVPEVDNDADGVLDSKWIDVGFPVMRTNDGTTFRARPAYLVLDLDSRLSVNAHGNSFQMDSFLTSAGVQGGNGNPLIRWPTESGSLPAGLTDLEFNDLAFGSGYGPAEVRLWDLFFDKPGFLPDFSNSGPGDDEPAALEADRRSQAFMYGSLLPESNTLTNQKRPTVSVSALAGRYGYDDANGGTPVPPGALGNDPLSVLRDEGRHPNHTAQNGARFPKSLANDWRVGIPPARIDPSQANADPDLFASPSDLSGRMKLIADPTADGQGVVSKMWYVKPQNYWQGDITDDAYELRLGHASASDNPFLPDELERVLRVYDWDASQLPTRLAGLLGPDSERLRLLLTTDSWDSTAIVGETWRQIEGSLTTRGYDPAQLPYLLGPELMSGRRMDLNRQISLADGTARARTDALCRNLYVLLWLLSDDTNGNQPTPTVCEAIAQWAVNVVDFRDPDSTMTRFFYDENPSDGWDIDPASSPLVIGQERPELLITEALCWKNDAEDEGGVHAVLHHPWSAKALDGDTVLPVDQNGDPIVGSDPLDPDAVAPELAARDPSGMLMNELDLGLLGGGDADSPVWRLRVGAGPSAAVIRFDLVDPSAITIDPAMPQYSSDDADLQARFMPPDGWMCITGNRGNAVGGLPVVSANLPQLAINQMDGLPTGPLPSSTVGTTDQVLVLERLADPGQPHDPDESAVTFNPYVEVDRIEQVPVANRSEVTPPPGSGVPKNYYAKRTRSFTGTTSAVFWQQQFNNGTLTTITNPNDYDPANEEKLDLLMPPAGEKVAWFPWLNRPYISPVELALVPNALVEYDANGQRYRSRLLEDYAGFSTGNGWLDVLATDLGLNAEVLVNDLLQATIIPSRFADLATSAADPTVFLNSGTALEWLSTHQLSSWREPGRVNLNTVSDDRVWDATVRRGARPAGQTSSTGDGLDRSDAGFGIPPDPTQGDVPTPAENLLDLIALDAGSGSLFADAGVKGQEPSDNPQLCCLTASRLANVATNRSNAFAIWITVGFFECNPNGTFVTVDDTNGNAVPKELGSDTGEVQRHRGFYVFDRSIPVGYVTGRDLNVDDAVRLRRIIQ
jgi:hypothetical protein